MNTRTIDSTTRIDWLAFTVRLPVCETWQQAHERLLDVLASELECFPSFDDADIRPITGRPPYRTATTKNGISLLVNHLVPHATVEVTGQGCVMLGEAGMRELLASKRVQEATTRLDIATDILTTVQPLEVQQAGYSERFESYSIVQSKSGDTLYVGSPKSDRFVRVYRYAEPHERAPFLRVEYVMRGDKAKAMMRFVADSTVVMAAASLNHVFDWRHPLFDSCKDSPRVPTIANNRASIGTQQWLMQQVRPALLKLAATGELSESFWQQFWMGLPGHPWDYGAGEESTGDRWQSFLDRQDPLFFD